MKEDCGKKGGNALLECSGFMLQMVSYVSILVFAIAFHF